MDHPSMSDTQVVVIPKAADLKSVIGVLTAKGKECGAQGPNKFILLSGSGNYQIVSDTDDNVMRSVAGEPVKPDSLHNAPEAKPLPQIKPCMSICFGELGFRSSIYFV